MDFSIMFGSISSSSIHKQRWMWQEIENWLGGSVFQSEQSMWEQCDTGKPRQCIQNGSNLVWQSFQYSLVSPTVKNLPEIREIWVQCLGREDSLEEEMATPSSILAGRVSWTLEPNGLQSGVAKSWTRLSD